MLFPDQVGSIRLLPQPLKLAGFEITRDQAGAHRDASDHFIRTYSHVAMLPTDHRLRLLEDEAAPPAAQLRQDTQRLLVFDRYIRDVDRMDLRSHDYES